MQQASTKFTKSKAQDASDACPSPADSLAQGTRTRRTLSKFGTKKPTPDRRGKISSNQSVVQIGVVSVRTQGFVKDAPNDPGVNDIEIRSPIEAMESPEPSVSNDDASKAHVVEDSLADLLEEEKEKFEKQIREKFLAEIAGQPAHADAVLDEDHKQDGRGFLLGGCFCVILMLIVAISIGVFDGKMP